MASEADNLPLLFDLWEIAAPAEGDLSFGLPGAAGEETTVWELDLPADLEAASAVLQRRSDLIQASLAALQAAPDDIEQFVQKAGGEPLSQVSYGILPEQALSAAEQDALRMLTYLEVGPEETSFAVAEQSKTDLDQASQQFQTALDRMLRLVRHFAWVETRLGGSLSGRTVVNWSGDMHNVWAEQIGVDVYGMHHKSVQQALVSRNILVHASVVTIRSAARLAVLLTNPAGAILAIPVAWKLVNQILKDVEKYRNLTNQEMNNGK